MEYAYDTQGRLIWETERGKCGTAHLVEKVHSCTYDKNGSQLIRRLDRYTHGGAASPGGVTLETGTGAGSGAVLLETRRYNGLGQLTELWSDARRTCCSYRPDGLRHRKSSPDSETTHLWDGSEMVAEYAGSGNMTARYLRGIGLIAREQNATLGLQYYLHNAHGDVVERTDRYGTTLKRYRYDTFGVEIDPEPLDSNPFRYCGEYFDKESETVYLRARSYRPSTGRFTSEDVARDGLNWYTYCGNEPVSFIDPMGLRQSLADFLKNRNNLNYDEPIDQGNSIFDRIVPRTEWGAIDVAYPKSQESWEMDIEKNEIVIHHSANFYKGPMWIDLNHYFKQWAGVGYHFMIDSKGTIYEGRPLDMKDVHVENANTGKIGIVLFGNFDPNSKISGKPSSQQLESMWALAAVLQEGMMML